MLPLLIEPLSDWVVPLKAPIVAPIATVTVLLLWPPIVKTTGTAYMFPTVPAFIPAGTTTLSWLSPTQQGASPENCTVAGIPPMMMVGIVAVCGFPAGGLAPVATGAVKAPRPVA